MTVDLDDLDLKILLMTHHTYDKLKNCEDRVLGKLGISTEQYWVLMAIKYLDDPVRVTQVAKWMGRSANSISMIVERMVRRGLVKRTKGKKDRRTVRITITGKAEAILGPASTATSELAQYLMSVLPTGDKLQFVKHLETLWARATSYLSHH